MNPAERLAAIAQAFQSEGKLQKAVGIAKYALDLFPEDQDVIYRLAVLLAESGDRSEAVSLLRQLRAMNPSYPRCHERLGQYLRKSCPSEAAAMLEIAVSQAPEDDGCWNSLALALVDAGLLTRAKSACEKAVRLVPTDAHYHWCLADVCERLEHFDEAEGHYEKAIELEPNDPFLYESLAMLHYSRNDLERANQTIQKALELFPDDEGLLLSSSEIMEHRGDINGAIGCLKRVVQLNPKSDSAWYWLGRYQLRRGNDADIDEVITQLDVLNSEAAADLRVRKSAR